jgi:hypothetical protein
VPPAASHWLLGLNTNCIPQPLPLRSGLGLLEGSASSKFHIRTDLSSLPVASHLLSGLNARAYTPPLPWDRIQVAAVGSGHFHNWAAPSALDAAIHWPSRLKPTFNHLAP